jgi:hypothetical protein
VALPPTPHIARACSLCNIDLDQPRAPEQEAAGPSEQEFGTEAGGQQAGAGPGGRGGDFDLDHPPVLCSGERKYG